MTVASRPRIEAFQNGRRVSVAPRPPVLSSFISLGESVVLERHIIPRAGEYAKREFPTNVLFLSQIRPGRVACQIDEKQIDAQMHPVHLWIVPRGASYAARFAEKHGGVFLSIGYRAIRPSR